jgi:hypothetical protein
MNAKTQAQYQNIDGNDLAQFKDARTQTVVSPSNLASGTLVYPYAKAKRRILKGGCDGRRASCRRGEPPPISLRISKYIVCALSRNDAKRSRSPARRLMALYPAELRVHLHAGKTDTNAHRAGRPSR